MYTLALSSPSSLDSAERDSQSKILRLLDVKRNISKGI
jgi:hypothetical protein